MPGIAGHNSGLLNRASADEVICWSRMQSEAGQDLTAIVDRKEIERRAGKGLFLWGVGNPPGLLPAKLARAGAEPTVVFSIMKTRPKATDSAPVMVLAWRRYVSADGRERPLPAHCLVTSRGATGTDAKLRHYALVCRSDTSLTLGDHGPFAPQAYRNLGGTGAPVGASQVTALMRRMGPEGTSSYRVNLQATLTQDLWVRLCDPVALCGSKLAALHGIDAHVAVDDWCDLVSWFREDAPEAEFSRSYQPAFL